MDIRLSDNRHPNEHCQILTCVDMISRRVKWTLGNRQTRGPECIFHFSCYLFSDTHLLINSCSVVSVNLLINIYSLLLFVPCCLSISVSLYLPSISKALLNMDSLQGCFSNYRVPSSMKVIAIRAPFSFSQSKAQNSGWDCAEWPLDCHCSPLKWFFHGCRQMH